jgi:hypothetical protein
VSCSLRDAAELESRGVPTVVYANDVFRPIAFGTAEILGFSHAYVDANVVFFAHPTSNLTRARIYGLVDDAIEMVERALLGTREAIAPSQNAGAHAIDISGVCELLDPLRASLLEDGATLVIDNVRGAVVHARLDVDEAACADGTCVLPRRNLVALLEAALGARYDGIHVELDDSRERSVAR